MDPISSEEKGYVLFRRSDNANGSGKNGIMVFLEQPISVDQRDNSDRDLHYRHVSCVFISPQTKADEYAINNSRLFRAGTEIVLRSDGKGNGLSSVPKLVGSVIGANGERVMNGVDVDKFIQVVKDGKRKKDMAFSVRNESDVKKAMAALYNRGDVEYGPRVGELPPRFTTVKNTNTTRILTAWDSVGSGLGASNIAGSFGTYVPKDGSSANFTDTNIKVFEAARSKKKVAASLFSVGGKGSETLKETLELNRQRHMSFVAGASAQRAESSEDDDVEPSMVL